MRKLRFPHPLTLLLGCILLAMALSWVLPSGEYTRRDDPVTGRSIVVPGTYHAVPSASVGPFKALVDIPKGMIDAADVIFLVFLVGAAFTVVDQTGVLRRAVDALVRGLEGRTWVVIPVISLLCATGGALIHMQEEFIALVPVLLVLTRRIGYDAVVAVAVSVGAAAVGSAFSPIDPFMVGIAQKLAQLPLLSGTGYRLVFLPLALAIWIGGTLRYAARTRVAPGAATLEPTEPGAVLPDSVATERAELDGTERMRTRDMMVLLLVVATFATYVYGILELEWGFNEMSGLFFAMGAIAGIVGGLGIGGTVDGYVRGFREMAFAGILIGFARAIYVVLQDGKIVDTIVSGLVAPVAALPVTLSALAMMVVQALIHFPVPSVSGQAVLTMPVLVPASDLLGLSRQVTVLAYQYGAGLTELIAPTNGALMAVLIAAGVRFDRWLKFALPLLALLFALGAVAVVAAIAIGLK
ncbi:MAG TPA: hypothetical protein VM890_02010 [Longimicrobium sp.]|nr:hypothetical protein [Longimicrobium sp.]